MNVFSMIGEGFRKVYSSNNGALKHTGLLILTGIISMSSLYSETLKEAMVMPDNIGLILFGALASLIIGIYLCGYNFELIHNSFAEEDILPELKFNHFSLFFKALPLMLTWTFYIIVVSIISALLMASKIALIIGLLLILVLAFLSSFLPFVFVEFSKSYDAKGLYGILQPCKYVKTIGYLILLGLLFIPIYIILCFVPAFIFGLTVGISSGGDSNLIQYGGGIIGGYFGFVVGMIWNYCMVQVYKAKFEPMAVIRTYE